MINEIALKRRDLIRPDEMGSQRTKSRRNAIDEAAFLHEPLERLRRRRDPLPIRRTHMQCRVAAGNGSEPLRHDSVVSRDGRCFRYSIVPGGYGI
jgi:hypothetical protein